MANYRVCFRLPTFVVQLSFEAAERDISYEEIAASINKEKVAELLCLDSLGYSAEDMEIITPEEYDEEVGYPEGGIAPGTKWEDVPEDFECPLCNVGKDEFSEVE